MSSLAATQADGYYVPPTDLDRNKYKPKSKHNQYLARSVVRFELPFDGFCTEPSCGAHVGRGTRFNAHKSHVGDYFTTKIYEFRTKCRICARSEFVIRTNPKERTFDYVSGIRRKVEEFDTLDAGTAGVVDTGDGGGSNAPRHHSHGHGDASATVSSEENEVANANPIDRLDREAHGQRVAMTERDALEALRAVSAHQTLDDAGSNAALRATYRKQRKAHKRGLRHARDLGLGKGIVVGEKPLTGEEEALARRAFDERRGRRGRGVAGTTTAGLEVKEREKRAFAKLRSDSIFSGVDSAARAAKRRSGKSGWGTEKTMVPTEVTSNGVSASHDGKPRSIRIKEECTSDVGFAREANQAGDYGSQLSAVKPSSEIDADGSKTKKNGGGNLADSNKLDSRGSKVTVGLTATAHSPRWSKENPSLMALADCYDSSSCSSSEEI